MNDNNEIIIHDLINKSLDGTITPEEILQLNQLIKSDEKCVAYYVSCMKTHCAFSKAKHLLREHLGGVSESGILLQKLAEYENTAPVIEIAKHEIPSESTTTETVKRAKIIKITKSRLVTAILSCAALLMVLAYAYLAQQTVEVATLVDSIGAKWPNADSAIEIGARLSTTRRPVVIKDGILKILYDNDVEVLIEGPAEYSIQSLKEMTLHYGRLFAKVSDAGKGFAVETRNTRIVDLGTEFGVYSDPQNDKTELHVFKGKTTLATTANKEVKNVGVISGQARQVDAAGQAKTIQFNKEAFVRAIDSKSNLVWRGQKLDLADMVSLGNGLGTGQATGRINPVGGFTETELTPDVPTKGYLSLTKSPFIDGIFVPDGRNEQIVSTQGDIFEGCPETSGIYYADLIANPRIGLFETESRKGTIWFGGQVYSDRSHPSIVIHANLGVTFNLNAIRNYYPGSKINRFVSKIGIADLEESSPCNADFWVLVDGKVQYSSRNVREKGVLKDIAVEINDTDHFLTLASTDGGDVDVPGAYKRSITCDWCVFVNPALEIE